MINDLAGINSATLPYHLLLFVRMSGLFILSPVFGRKNVPLLLKAGFCLLLTLILGTAQPAEYVIDDSHLLIFAVDILKELIIGLILGFISILFFSISLIAGQIIDVEIGLGVGSLFDPQMNTQASVSGVLLNLLMMVYFFINNGHLRLIRILAASTIRIPIGQVHLLSANLGLMAIEQFSLCFGLAVSLMLPLIAMALLTETALGILMRAMPQLNAYMVGIPLKILAGLAVLYLTQPLYVTYCDKIFNMICAASEQWIIRMGVSQ